MSDYIMNPYMMELKSDRVPTDREYDVLWDNWVGLAKKIVSNHGKHGDLYTTETVENANETIRVDDEMKANKLRATKTMAGINEENAKMVKENRKIKEDPEISEETQETMGRNIGQLKLNKEASSDIKKCLATDKEKRAEFLGKEKVDRNDDDAVPVPVAVPMSVEKEKVDRNDDDAVPVPVAVPMSVDVPVPVAVPVPVPVPVPDAKKPEEGGKKEKEKYDTESDGEEAVVPQAELVSSLPAVTQPSQAGANVGSKKEANKESQATDPTKKPNSLEVDVSMEKEMFQEMKSKKMKSTVEYLQGNPVPNQVGATSPSSDGMSQDRNVANPSTVDRKRGANDMFAGDVSTKINEKHISDFNTQMNEIRDNFRAKFEQKKAPTGESAKEPEGGSVNKRAKTPKGEGGKVITIEDSD